jgi:hypothetical protein
MEHRRTTSGLRPADTAALARADGGLVGAASLGNGRVKQPQRGGDMGEGQNARFDPPGRFLSAARITGTCEPEVAAAGPGGRRATAPSAATPGSSHEHG